MLCNNINNGIICIWYCEYEFNRIDKYKFSDVQLKCKSRETRCLTFSMLYLFVSTPYTHHRYTDVFDTNI